uniref:Reverse transcriptase zinc-binding domain-containing protein n=1 Tax=Cajanus cajan TaxID=3821 RepID=A0A151SFS3_CAJCA|nr:hypothetical protein KK1_024256 [Cajanus cajan]KYP53698.1 hypothetical protein KK1_024272 [Cajanus cajan]
MNIHASFHSKFKCSVNCFLKNGSWHLLTSIQSRIGNQIDNITIPLCELEDSLNWDLSPNEDMTFKDAYAFIRQPKPKLNWAKTIWDKSTPSSKSFILLRLLHGKIPNEDLLRKKGVIITSICSHCYNAYESTTHLFFECSFALHLWDWLSRLMDVSLNTVNILDILSKPWSKFAKLVILAAIIFTIDELWNSRNQVKFHNRTPKMDSLKTKIITLVNSCSSLSPLTMNNKIQELKLLNIFLLPCRGRGVDHPIEVHWIPPSLGWIKCNTDGAFFPIPLQLHVGSF